MTGMGSKHWAVVGGGMLGLTLAFRLSQKGHKVTVLEADQELGGLAGTWEIGGIRWDKHYHVMLLSDVHLRNLLHDLELEQEVSWVETKTGFYCGGRFLSMSSVWEFLTFPVLKWCERMRLGGTIFMISRVRNWHRLEKLTVEKWLKRWSGEIVWQKIWRPLLRAKLGESYTKTSAVFIWAHTQRMYKARSRRHGRETFGYVHGGYARILNRLAEVLKQRGAEVIVGAGVSEAVVGGGGRIVVRLDNGVRREFDRVVYTVPAPIIAATCLGLSSEERSGFNNIEYLGIVCSSVLLKKPLSEYYITNITDEEVPFTGVIELTAVVDKNELGGLSLVYLPKYTMDEEELSRESDEKVKERCLSTLERMYPKFSRKDVVDFKVSRARYLMALPTLCYSEYLPNMETSIPGVWAVNSAQILKGNLNVNETIQVVETALNKIFENYQVQKSGTRSKLKGWLRRSWRLFLGRGRKLLSWRL